MLWTEWLFVNGALLADLLACGIASGAIRARSQADIARDETRVHPAAVRRPVAERPAAAGRDRRRSRLLDPGKAVARHRLAPVAVPARGRCNWRWSACRWLLGAGHARRANRFNYGAIVEVAALFFGIFICMQPAAADPRRRGAEPGADHSRAHFFWATGSLSSVLDNAPTYVVFFETAKSLDREARPEPAVAGVAERLLVAVSLGAVFMGANTYIGNGPNFMVKAIAEKSGVAHAQLLRLHGL